MILALYAGLNNGKGRHGFLSAFGVECGVWTETRHSGTKLTTRQLNFSMFAQSTQLDSLTMGMDYKRTMGMADDFDMKMNKEMMNIRGNNGGVG